MRVGLFGGSFDPVHNAHLKLASAALSQLKLDRVYFVFSPRSPFKQRMSQTSPQIRLAMLRKALAGSKKFRAALWELRRKGPSYTYDTLRWYKRKHPSHDLFFILGSDSYAEFDKWKNSAGMRKLCTLVVGRRPGSRYPRMSTGRNPNLGAGQKRSGATVLLKGIFPPVSSTAIRKQIAKNKSVTGKIPPVVLKFIKKRKLFSDVRAI